MTCTGLALISKNLDPAIRSVLFEALKLLATCCPVELPIHSLPPLETLPEHFRQSSTILRQYRNLQDATENPRDMMLSDALAMLRILQQAGRPQDFGALAKLLEVTEGLRASLELLQEAGLE
jgi:hypothetical protein